MFQYVYISKKQNSTCLGFVYRTKLIRFTIFFFILFKIVILPSSNEIVDNCILSSTKRTIEFDIKNTILNHFNIDSARAHVRWLNMNILHKNCSWTGGVNRNYHWYSNHCFKKVWYDLYKISIVYSECVSYTTTAVTSDNRCFMLRPYYGYETVNGVYVLLFIMAGKLTKNHYDDLRRSYDKTIAQFDRSVGVTTYIYCVLRFGHDSV